MYVKNKKKEKINKRELKVPKKHKQTTKTVSLDTIKQEH